jgi:hypothetical protein
VHEFEDWQLVPGIELTACGEASLFWGIVNFLENWLRWVGFFALMNKAVDFLVLGVW